MRLVTELCLEYKIYDLQLWNGLLQKLLGFNMVRLGTLPCSVVSSSGPAALQPLPAMLATERMHAANVTLPGSGLHVRPEKVQTQNDANLPGNREGGLPGLV